MLQEDTGLQVDPVSLELFRNQMVGLAEEIWYMLKREAYSINIKERGDCSAAIFDWRGETIAIPPDGVPLHQGSLFGFAAEVLRRYPATVAGDGDMFITNDAYTGGTHANDYCVLAPVYVAGEGPIAYVANLGHHSDVGGRVACSIAPDARTQFEEGVLLPPIRLVRLGEPVEEVFDIICHNSRERAERFGDLWAQVSANRVGVRRLGEVVEGIGVRGFRANVDALLNYGEQRMRVFLESIEDGAWEATDYLDSDGSGSGMIELHLKLVKRGGELILDWSEMPEQFPSARNVPLTTLQATSLCVLRGQLDPDMSLNSGIHHVVRFVTREGSLVNPTHPAAVGDRATTTQVLADLVAACVSQMCPMREIAGSGSFQGWAFGGLDARRKPYTSYESIAGATGAMNGFDGIDGVRCWPSGSMNAPIEAYEQDAPAVFRAYSLRPDSGGAGRYQGGLGLRRDIEIRGHDVRMTLYTMRRVAPALGLGGGTSGATAEFVVNPGTVNECRLPPVVTDYSLALGDVVSCLTPGGGGFGPPSERSVTAVHHDLEQGRISPAFAAEHYGGGDEV